MQNAPELVPESAVLRSRPSLFILYFFLSFCVYFALLIVGLSLPRSPLSFGAFANWAFALSLLFFVVICLTLKPVIVADSNGLYFNTIWRKKRLDWAQISTVEWRPVMQGTPGAVAYGATHVARINPVLKDNDDNDLIVIDYAVWGRNQTEQRNFIEFVGRQIDAAKK